MGATVTMILFGMLQVLPAPPRTNPPSIRERRIETNLRLTPEVSGLLGRACANCHSNETRWPWYSRVAPMSWWIGNDVIEARKQMNFSEWPLRENSIATLTFACAVVDAGNMPPQRYVLLHPEARLSQADKTALCEWTEAQAAALAESGAERARCAAAPKDRPGAVAAR